MGITAARLELERSYRILVDCQETNDQERQLAAAMHVIVAWEAISHEVTVLAQDAIWSKALTRVQ